MGSRTSVSVAFMYHISLYVLFYSIHVLSIWSISFPEEQIHPKTRHVIVVPLETDP